MRAISALILCAAALLAVPAAAQQSPRDFTLPPPTAEPAQGPVDDSGLVPVAPRAIPVQAPAQEPASDAETGPEPESEPASEPPAVQPDDARGVIDARGSHEAEIAPAPKRGFEPAPPVGASATEPDGQGSMPPPVRSAQATAEPLANGSVIPALARTLAGLVTALVLMVIGALAIRRRRTARRVPIIEPAPADPRAIADDRIDSGQAVEIAVEISGLSRSLMMLSLNCELSITNRSVRALRNLSIHADITSAHRTLPVDRQLALEGTVLPLCATIERIGPHQSLATRLNLQLPVGELAAFRRGEAIACVPLLRIRVEAPSIDSRLQTHVIGLANGSVTGRLQPVPLHTPPGSYPEVRARALA